MVIADGLREILCLTLVGKLCQGLCSERAGAGQAIAEEVIAVLQGKEPRWRVLAND